MKRFVLIGIFLWAQAAAAASPVIVDSDHVAAGIGRNAVIWDVRPADAYAKGHIAGAVSIGGGFDTNTDAEEELLNGLASPVVDETATLFVNVVSSP